MIDVFVVDDNPKSSSGVCRVLDGVADMRCVGVAGTIATAREEFATIEPEIVLLEIDIEEGVGLELLHAWHAHGQGRPLVLVYSRRDELEWAEESLAQGAVGYVMKEPHPKSLPVIIRQVLAGGRFLSPRVTQHILIQLAQDELFLGHELYSLSDDEQRVFDLIGQGLRSPRIAEVMHISVADADVLVSSLMSKLQVEEPWEIQCRACKTPDCVAPAGDGDADVDVASGGYVGCYACKGEHGHDAGSGHTGGSK